MINEIDCTNLVDEDGNPAGGDVVGCGLHIVWQNGPRRREGQIEMDPANGAFVEDVIESARQRLQFFELGPYACAENAAAIQSLTDALERLAMRRRDRNARGVEGMHIQ